MASSRRWLARGLDVLAAVIVLFALFQFFVAPRLAANRVVPAPPVDLATLTDRRFALSGHRGRVVFLDFWASWCEPCKQSIPLIQAYARTHPNVDVVSVDVGEPESVVRNFARTHPMSDIALDPDETVAHAFGIVNFPTMIAIDPSGDQRAKWVGFNPAIAEVMDEASKRLRKKATAGIPAAGADIPSRPVTLVIEDDPNSLSTIRNTPFGWQLGPLTQGYLFLVDDRGELVADRALAVPTRANGGISADGRTITYRIRTGRWSDGAPFDARDVGFTIDALRNPRTSVPDTSAVADVVTWSAPRPDRLIVHLRHPWAPFVSSFLTLGANDPFSILPRHLVGSLASLDRSTLDTNPVGLGPFRLVSWKRGERLTFERNPAYWRGPAAASRVVVDIVPNAQTRLVLMRSGTVDAIEVTGFGIDVARQLAGIRLASHATNVVDYLQFNMRSPELRNLTVRRAIAAAVDRARLATTVYRGTLDASDALQFDPRYRTADHFPTFDPVRAKRSLARAPLNLDFAIASEWRNSSNVAVQIVAELAAVGVTAHIKPYTQAQFWGPKDRGGILESARYDIALTSWSPALDPDRSYLFGCAAIPPGGGNSMAYCSRAYDANEAAGAAVYEPAQRIPFYRAAGALIARDIPVLPLGFERRTYAISATFAGFRPGPLGRDFWNAWEFRRTG